MAEFKSKSHLYYYAPEDLVRITDETDPLYDPRVHWPADEAIVAAMMDPEIGYAGPPIVIEARYPHGRAKPGSLVVVDGRRRHAAALEANKRLRKAGESKENLIEVPVTHNKGRDAEVTMVLLGEHRKDDDMLARARKARGLQARGKSDAAIRKIFGISPPTLASWWLLLQAPPEDLKAIEEKKAVASDAVKKVRTGKAPATRTPKERLQLSIAQIRQLRGTFEPEEKKTLDGVSEIVASVLAFILGEDKDAKRLGQFAGSEAAVRLLRKARSE